MPATPYGTRPPLRLIELSAFLADPASLPRTTPANRARFDLACRTLFDPALIDPTTRLGDLDIGALAKAAAQANPALEPATLREYERAATVAVDALRESRNPPGRGTVAHLPAFLTRARERGDGHTRTLANDIHAVRRLLRDLPDLLEQDLATLDLEKVARRFTELNPAAKETTVKAYIARLQHAITTYTAPPAEEAGDQPAEEPAPAAPPRPTTPAPAPHAHPGAAPASGTEQLAIPLPGGRAVSLCTPPDLTEPEAAATGAVLRLYHPAMFAASPPAARRAHCPVPGAGRCCSGPNMPPTSPKLRT